MPQYFFILGRNPELSLAEIAATLPSEWRLISYSKAVLMVECKPLDVEILMRRLGGTVKMGRIIAPSTSSRGAQHRGDLFTMIKDCFASLAMTEQKGKKLFLGLSAYATSPAVKLPSVRALRQLGIEVKRVLQEKQYRVRLVTSKEIALSSVIVKKERLLRQGTEIVLFYGAPSHLPTYPLTYVPLIGQTLAVQEFEEASQRDFGRPERSMGVGMLPIQLTKIMLNLARVPISVDSVSEISEPESTQVILDPFCGLGTVLMEASQMGYQNLIGSDLEQTMIDATRENLKWLASQKQSFSDSRETENVKLLTTPVEQLSNHLPAQSVDAIVTEPYMGPTRGIRNYELGIMDELVKLYNAAFREFAKIMKSGGRVVFILPAFKNGAQLTKTSDRVLPEIKKLGFEPMQLLPDNLRTHLPSYPRTSILYSRPDQRVLREIFVFDFKK